LPLPKPVKTGMVFWNKNFRTQYVQPPGSVFKATFTRHTEHPVDRIQLKERAQAIEDWFLANPDPPKGFPRVWLYKSVRTVYAVSRDMVSGLLSLHAMSLVFTTLLSIVPLLALSFSVLKALGAHQRMEPFLFQFFEPMGPQGIELAAQILEFVDQMKVGVLGSVGLILLVYTVISLLQKIESAFNSIWRVPNLRSMGQRFSNYLSVIMVGPLLMVSAIGISATVFSSTIIQMLMEIEPFGTAILLLNRFMPFFLVVLAFTFIYVFMPNTRVKLKYAIVGGLIAGILWQAGSMGFAYFVATSTRYAAIYSSFAIGIFLLIWIYLNWLILLMGAGLVFYLQNPGSIAKHREVQLSPELQEKTAMAMMWMVCKPFSEGKPAPREEDVEQRLNIPGETVRSISNKLIRGGLLNIAGAGGELLVPGRALELITVGRVLDVVRADEEQLVCRLPDILPENLKNPERLSSDTSFAALLRGD